MKLWRYGRAIEQLGQRYRLDGVLGSGGMADVCLAWDVREEREVAVKVIKPGEMDQTTLDRFLKEAAQVAKWRHPNILRIYGDVRLELLDAVHGSIVPYIVMEYAQGGDLHKRLRPGEPYPLTRALRVFEPLCRAVAYAHEQGVIHRDLKPLNILFRQEANGTEQMVLSDFGLAVEIAATHFTFAGGGTLPYMAPEQLRGRAEPASDIFALGVILYQLCTGNLPFRRSIQDLQLQNMLAEPPAPSNVNPQLPEELDAVILRALAADPRQRFATAVLFWESIHAAFSVDTIDGSMRNSGEQVRRPRPIPRTPGSNGLTNAGRDASSLRGGQRSQSIYSNSIEEAEIIDLPVVRGLPTQRLGQTDPYLRRPNNATVSNQQRSQSGYGTGEQASGIGEPQTGSSIWGILPPEPRTGKSVQPLLMRTDSALVTPVQTAARSSRPKKGHKLWTVGALLLIGLLLVGVILALALPAGFTSLRSILPGGLANPATVTIVPDSKLVQNSYQLSAVTGQPDPQMHQVALQPLTFTTPAQQRSVTGTGTAKTAGVAAKGTLTFINGAFVGQMVPAGTILTGKSGIKVENDTVVNIPPATVIGGTGNTGMIDVSAHAVDIGAVGNISAHDTDQSCCSTDKTIFVKNLSAFTGGQDPQNYTFVQQSDVDGVVNPLKASLDTTARTGLKGQLKPGWQLASIQCSAVNVQADQKIGDSGVNITSANLTISETCTGNAYDQAGAQTLVKRMLANTASSTLGAGYELVGNVVIVTTVQNNSPNSVPFLMSAKGVWVYQFTDNGQKQHLLSLIVQKSTADASSTLKLQRGVKAVTINAGGNALPSAVGQITLNVQPVAGLSGTNTSGGGQPSSGPATVSGAKG